VVCWHGVSCNSRVQKGRLLTLLACRIVNGALNYQIYARPSFEIISLLLEDPSDRERAPLLGLLLCYMMQHSVPLQREVGIWWSSAYPILVLPCSQPDVCEELHSAAGGWHSAW
jgi:hypothetical protein